VGQSAAELVLGSWLLLNMEEPVTALLLLLLL
jgi:hypothetical protein